MNQKIPPYIKWNDDKDNPRFIADGMNEFERNIKRIFDFLVAGICLVIFSPPFSYLLYHGETGRRRAGYFQARAYRTVWQTVYDL